MPRLQIFLLIFCAYFHVNLAGNNDDCSEEDHFKCKLSRACILKSYLCDGNYDCGENDISDETSCHLLATVKPENCTDDMFKCLDGLCIPKGWVCNGNVECLDGSDEHYGCESNVCDDFKCNNGHCIPHTWKCDHHNDCGDNSDEISCPSLTPEKCKIEDRQFLCEDKSKCIPLKDVCNKHADCSDGSDEGRLCLESKCNQTNCKYACRQLPTGPKCTCFAGYRQVGSECLDIDECQEFGICDQFCENTVGSYNCSCSENYFYDGATCRADGAEANLIFTTQNEIRMYLLSSKQYFTVASDLKNLTTAIYDGRNIYWTTIEDGEEAIMRSDIFGTKIERLFTAGLGIPEGLAVDYVTKNIYFSDSYYKHIAVCDEHGFTCVVLYNECDKPSFLVLYVEKGEMLWSDWGKSVIMRAGMNGMDPKRFIKNDIIWPTGLTIDHVTDRLYWTDNKLNTIETIRMDGSDRRKITTSGSPFSLDVFEDLVYWSNWKNHGIMTCNKFSGKNCHLLIEMKYTDIISVQVYHPNNIKVQEKTDPCIMAKCSHLCVLAPSKNGLDYSCKCPEGMELSSNQHKCTTLQRKDLLFVGGKDKLIQIEPTMFGKFQITHLPDDVISILGAITYDSVSARLIMSDLVNHVLIAYDIKEKHMEPIETTKIGKVVGMDFDNKGNNLFWVDEEFKSVEVLNLNTHKRLTLIRDFGNDTPMDIAINTEDGLIYLAMNEIGRPCIDQIPIDGSTENKIHMVTGNLVGPRITLFYDYGLERLYWTDSHGMIASTNKHGTDFHVFQEIDKSTPVEVVAVGRLVFWSLFGSSSIYFDDSHQPGLYKKIELAETNMGSQIKIAAYHPTTISHECNTNNGNCSDLCIPNGKDKLCMCSDEKRLSSNGLTCKKIIQCERHEYRCLSGMCIPSNLVCNKKADCPDAEDEESCNYSIEAPEEKCFGQNCENEKTCRENDFHCDDGTCIPNEYRCDEKYDCSDQSDEQGCNMNTCNYNQFKCNSGNCLPMSWVCDGESDCSDNSDELLDCGKPACDKTQFTCKNGNCIDLLMKCNDDNDCGDGSDEIDCEIRQTTALENLVNTTEIICNPEEFLCISSQKCLPANIRCNGTNECPKGEDEIECNDICPINEFKCYSTNKCITKLWVCDGIPDCPDNSDELSCHSSAEINEKSLKCIGYHCKNDSSCIPWTKVCDSNKDCSDGSDEGGLCGRSCESALCSGMCVETPMGHKCICKSGFTLTGDGRTCVDVNECLTNSLCSQYCYNTPGSFRCSCNEKGYKLREDRISCKAFGPKMQYVYVTKDEIRIKSQSLHRVSTIYKADTNEYINSIDLDTNGKYIYSTLDYSGTVMKISLETNIKKPIDHISNLDRPTKIAYDWITDNVYIVEKLKSIKVCSFDKKKCANLYAGKSNIKIQAIAVDSNSRTMFWSELHQQTHKVTIKKSDTAGNSVENIVTEDNGDVSDIALDSIQQNVYWANTKEKVIKKVDYNGTLIEIVRVTQYPAKNIALFEDNLYWINGDRYFSTYNNDITKCNLKFSTNICEHIPLLPIQSTALLNNLRLLHPALQIQEFNECSNATCDDLCLISYNSTICLCQSGEKVNAGEKCKEISVADKVMFGRNHVDQVHSEFNWLLIFWEIIICIIIIGVIIIYRRYYHKLALIPSVYFRNGSSENLSEELTLHCSQNIFNKHEYINPLSKVN